MDVEKSEVEIAILNERKRFVEYINQMQEMHEDNKSTVTVLDFLKDLIEGE